MSFTISWLLDQSGIVQVCIKHEDLNFEDAGGKRKRVNRASRGRGAIRVNANVACGQTVDQAAP